MRKVKKIADRQPKILRMSEKSTTFVVAFGKWIASPLRRRPLLPFRRENAPGATIASEVLRVACNTRSAIRGTSSPAKIKIFGDPNTSPGPLKGERLEAKGE